ncbi:MAG: hypothetical protein U1G07_24235 [Verrucomicrobiota bacterium]
MGERRSPAAYGLPITAVRDAVERQNASIPGGNVIGPLRGTNPPDNGTDHRSEGIQRSRDCNSQRFAHSGAGHWLGGGRHQRAAYRLRLDGRPNVTLEIVRQSGANTVAVIEASKANWQN